MYNRLSNVSQDYHCTTSVDELAMHQNVLLGGSVGSCLEHLLGFQGNFGWRNVISLYGLSACHHPLGRMVCEGCECFREAAIGEELCQAD